MSFLKRLFGGGGKNDSEAAQAEMVVAGEEEHEGFLIQATPFKQNGEFQVSGVVSKTVNGERKEHRFIRADRFASMDDAAAMALRKGKQMIKEQGDRLFS